MVTFWQRINRLLRHAWPDEHDLHRAVSQTTLDELRQHISRSEQQHSGEIRVCVETSLPWQRLWSAAPMADIVRERALAVFSELGVWDTANNNGVLIYVLLAEHGIEIVADRGLNALVPAAHWQGLIAQMEQAFKSGQFQVGLTQGVDAVTQVLRQHFHTTTTQVNPNELPDRPVLR